MNSDLSHMRLVFPAARTVIQAEARAWIAATPAPSSSSVITSLPDYSELTNKGFAGWKVWFVDTVRALIRWLPEGGVAIFYQSDIRHEGIWVDKGYLVMRAAEEEQAALLWHKIVCRNPPGTIAVGRPSYSHMLCVKRGLTAATPKRPGVDVLADAGFMPWPRAMGQAACKLACRYIVDETRSSLVVDPFCGHGSLLAVANSYGLAAIGVDLSPKRCQIARSQNL